MEMLGSLRARRYCVYKYIRAFIATEPTSSVTFRHDTDSSMKERRRIRRRKIKINKYNITLN